MRFRSIDSLLPCTEVQRATELSIGHRRDMLYADAYSERNTAKKVVAQGLCLPGIYK